MNLPVIALFIVIASAILLAFYGVKKLSEG